MPIRDSLDNLVAGLAAGRAHLEAQVDLSGKLAANLGVVADAAGAAAGRLTGGPGSISVLGNPGGVKNRLAASTLGPHFQLADNGATVAIGADGLPIPATVPASLQGGGSLVSAREAGSTAYGPPGTVWTDPATGITYTRGPDGLPIGYQGSNRIGSTTPPSTTPTTGTGTPAPPPPNSGASPATQPAASSGGPAYGAPGTVWTDPETGITYTRGPDGLPIGYAGSNRIGRIGPPSTSATPSAGAAQQPSAPPAAGSSGPAYGPPGSLWTDPETGAVYTRGEDGLPIGYAGSNRIGSILPPGTGTSAQGAGSTAPAPARLAPYDFWPPHVIAGRPNAFTTATGKDTSVPTAGEDKIASKIDKLASVLQTALVDQGRFNSRGATS